MDIVDLTGASGAVYRFRLWPDSDFHPPMAGNFLVMGATGGPILIGVTDDLSGVKSLPLPQGRLFTRLNVSRAIRTEEYADLVAAYPGRETAPGMTTVGQGG